MAKKDESVRTYHWNSAMQFSVRLASLMLPIAIITYGALLRFNILKASHPAANSIIGDWDFYVISFLFLGWGIWQFLLTVETKLNVTIKVIALHLIFGLFFIFILGTNTPLLTFWILLSMEAYTYFFSRGYWLSIIVLALTIFTSVFIWQVPTTDTITYGIVILIMIYYLSSFVISNSKTNIVERKELNTAKTKEALQRDRIVTIINNLADAIISTDIDGVIKVCNSASLNLLDTNSSLIGRHIDNVLPVVDLAGEKVSVFAELQAAKSAKKRDDLSYNFNDEDNMRLEIIFSPIHSNYSHSKDNINRDGYIAILRDVTKEKSLEEERDEFISVAGHELRTPITIAEGAMSNVKVMRSDPNTPDDKLDNTINVAHDQIIFLADLINDLNTLSSAEQEISETELFDIHEITNKLLNDYESTAKSKKLQFNIVLSPKLNKINTNKSYVEKILQNLVSNSIKYTKKGGIKVIIKQKNGHTQFTVQDTGIGISRTDQAKLFGKFYRSEDYRTRETGGTGLGLYVAAKLADRIGAKIKLTSRLGYGSIFSFVINNK